jgi:pyruvate/2-oxoglutarate dehydrogenase complex dihydrolipoamide acyltransferase (E2) component
MARRVEFLPGDAVPVVLPDFGAGEGLRLSSWFVEPGEIVSEGDLLLEVAIPGVTADVASPASGRVLRLDRSLDQMVRPGEVLAWIQPDLQTARAPSPMDDL